MRKSLLFSERNWFHSIYKNLLVFYDFWNGYPISSHIYKSRSHSSAEYPPSYFNSRQSQCSYKQSTDYFSPCNFIPAPPLLDSQISKTISEESNNAKKVLIKVVKSTKYMSRQKCRPHISLAIPGHKNKITQEERHLWF